MDSNKKDDPFESLRKQEGKSDLDEIMKVLQKKEEGKWKPAGKFEVRSGMPTEKELKDLSGEVKEKVEDMMKLLEKWMTEYAAVDKDESIGKSVIISSLVTGLAAAIDCLTDHDREASKGILSTISRALDSHPFFGE